MDHIAYLRIQFQAVKTLAQSYDLPLHWLREKIIHDLLFENPMPYFVKTWTSLTEGCFVPSGSGEDEILNFSKVFSLFCYYILGKERTPHLNWLEFPSPEDAFLSMVEIGQVVCEKIFCNSISIDALC